MSASEIGKGNSRRHPEPIRTGVFRCDTSRVTVTTGQPGLSPSGEPLGCWGVSGGREGGRGEEERVRHGEGIGHADYSLCIGNRPTRHPPPEIQCNNFDTDPW